MDPIRLYTPATSPDSNAAKHVVPYKSTHSVPERRVYKGCPLEIQTTHIALALPVFLEPAFLQLRDLHVCLICNGDLDLNKLLGMAKLVKVTSYSLPHNALNNNQFPQS